MAKAKAESVISILLVDDIAEIRLNIRKLLSLENDFDVVGMAATSKEALSLARELQPDIIIMDINLPDVDGLQITTQIMNFLPETGIIIMSAQDDQSYMRLAMIAGAKAFLTKPSSPDEIYNTVRAVYRRARAPQLQATYVSSVPTASADNNDNRAGNIITVYSPQGGAGCTTVATNLASALTRENIRVLLVDANLQFGDVSVFLNLDPRSTLVDLMGDIDDMDTEYFENVVTTHNSGLKVLLGPTRPELAEKVTADPTALAKILGKIRGHYDFIIIDTSLHLDEMTLSLMDIATRIILVTTSSLTSIKNTRSILDFFDQLAYGQDKVMLILNQVSEDQHIRKLFIARDKIIAFLKRPIACAIPINEYLMLDAIRKGIPAVALERDVNKSPTKELIALSNTIITALLPQIEEQASTNTKQKTVTKAGARKRVEQYES